MTKPSAQVAELDRIYSEMEAIFHACAKACGLSDCAYWVLYALNEARRPLLVRELRDAWSYSKQTLGSAVKSLQAEGLITLSYAQGSRKSKVVAMTDAGRAFAGRHISPAAEAEACAMETLSPEERSQMIALTRAYADSLALSIERVMGIDVGKRP